MENEAVIKIIRETTENQQTELNLARNQLRKMPPEIAELRKIVKLDLAENILAQLPPEIGELDNLRELNLEGNKIRQLPPEIAELKKLEALYLSGNQLTKLPSGIGELKKLEALYLDGNQLTKLPSEIAELKNLRDLNISENKLTELPPEIGELDKLAILDLFGNQITRLPPEIRQLENLQVLNISENNLTQLSTTILDLKNLRILFLYGNQIMQLPTEIVNLRHLTELYLSDNYITGLPAEITNLKKLIKLDLSQNQLTKLPAEITKLKKLKSLELFGNNLTELPAEIGELNNLEELDLFGNQFTELPLEILTLKKLTRLNLAENQLTHLSPEIVELENLKSLFLTDNKLTQLPPEIIELKNLTNINLAGNKLTQLPQEILELKNLTRLNLSRNQLTELPAEIVKLEKLTDLDLAENKLTQLPSEITELKNLTNINLAGNKLMQLPPEIVEYAYDIKWKKIFFEEGICLENNPLEKPPIEIVKQGKEAIIEYFRSIEGEKLPLNEVKALLVGDGGAGKTSLVNRIVDRRFNENESQTHGININNWTFHVENEEIKVNIWDFGGQEIMHATHQFFLSKRSMYILVLDSRKDEKTEYWLKHIESFGGNSPIIVVINKIDENPSFDVNRKFLKEKYPSIKGFYEISCKDGRGIENLISNLKIILSNINHVKETWPKSWFKVKEWMENLDEPFIKYDDFEKVCIENNIENEKSQEVLVGFLHDLGVVLNFRDLELFGTQVLKPRWITGAVYSIINSELLADSNGVLKLEDLDSILKKKNGGDFYYPKTLYPYIVNLMRKFELCYELSRCYQKESKTVLLPQLLPVSEPYFDFDYDSSLKFVLDYDGFLPPSVIPRFIVKMNADIKSNLQWRTGAILEYSLFDSIAVIRADVEAKRIYVYVNGNQRRDYFAVILSSFREINRSFTNLKVIEKIPMPDNPNVTITYEHLIRLESKGISEYLPDGSDKAYDVSELLGSIAVNTKNEREIIDILRRLKTQSDTELTLMEKIIDALSIEGKETETKRTLLQKGWDSLSIQPGAFGVSVDIKKLIDIVVKEK